jgi:hypothetical protein
MTTIFVGVGVLWMLMFGVALVVWGVGAALGWALRGLFGRRTCSYHTWPAQSEHVMRCTRCGVTSKLL